MRTALLSLVAAGALGAAAGPAAAQGAHGACHISLRAEAEPASFADAGRNAAAARTAQLARETGAAFAAAASRLCASGAIRRAHVAPFSRLLVRNAEGAADPAVYDDSEQQPGALIIEYAFAGGGAPAPAAIETAIRCWRDPERVGCGEDVSP
ncbi:MAG TPA: hypothetical protein VES64_04495 [Allosphingosinicella sp.]|nr:hypothetical protein [Allosphingosinicella sp.]